MGCVNSQVTDCPASNNNKLKAKFGKESVVDVLTRFENEIVKYEALHQPQRLFLCVMELKSIEQELLEFEGVTSLSKNESYAGSMHQMFISLNLYRRPLLIAENEDFVANVNRKEMRRLEAFWLRNRQQELQSEVKVLQSHISRLKSLDVQFDKFLNSIWSAKERPGLYLEKAFERTLYLRDALSLVSIRLRAATNYAQNSLRLIDEALPAWKLASIGKNGVERLTACADASRLFVQARCLERGARRVLGVQAAPRAARTLRLSLDYIFTDYLHDYKYRRATETFIQFKEALVELVNSINQVFLSNMDNLAVVEKDLAEKRTTLRAARVNDIANKRLTD